MFKSVTKKALIVTAALTMVVGAGSAFAQNWKGNVEIDGSSTVFPLTQAIAVEFGGQNPDVKITVGNAGTGAGMGRFCRGEINIADASRPISDSEKAACASNSITPVQYRVAFDGVTVVVNEKNTWAKKLTMDQLKKMFQKDSTVRLWSDVDPSWPKRVISFYSPSTAHGTYEYFTDKVNGTKKVQRLDQIVTAADTNGIVTGVAGNKYAIGYLGYDYYSTNKSTLNAVSVSEDGKTFVAPNKGSIQNFKYPISRTLYVYVNKKKVQANKVENAFMKFYLQNASDIAGDIGMVPLGNNLYKTELKKVK
jgi:phosphate transport system substrate-binding protein